jgi:hypothetical protein
MKVYHGSDTIIEEIDLDKCMYGRDFGRGFYVTKLPEQAKTMAARVSKWSEKKPIITEFEFNEFALIDDELKILRFDDYEDDWLDFVVLNRKNQRNRQAHDYDIVEGPVADDKITTQIDDYISGVISRDDFMDDLIYEPSHQICFCTVQSLQALSRIMGKVESAIFHIGEHIIQTLMSEFGMTEMQATDLYCTSKAYIRLDNEKSGLYLRPWQEIYQMLLKELKM